MSVRGVCTLLYLVLYSWIRTLLRWCALVTAILSAVNRPQMTRLQLRLFIAHNANFRLIIQGTSKLTVFCNVILHVNAGFRGRHHDELRESPTQCAIIIPSYEDVMRESKNSFIATPSSFWFGVGLLADAQPSSTTPTASSLPWRNHCCEQQKPGIINDSMDSLQQCRDRARQPSCDTMGWPQWVLGCRSSGHGYTGFFSPNVCHYVTPMRRPGAFRTVNHCPRLRKQHYGPLKKILALFWGSPSQLASC